MQGTNIPHATLDQQVVAGESTLISTATYQKTLHDAAHNFPMWPLPIPTKTRYMLSCLDQQSCFRTFSACFQRHPEIDCSSICKQLDPSFRRPCAQSLSATRQVVNFKRSDIDRAKGPI
jgi:hypothetical protein